MGLVTTGFALANLFSGMVSQMMVVVEESSSLDVYFNSFRMIGLTVIGFAFIILILNHQKRGLAA